MERWKTVKNVELENWDTDKTVVISLRTRTNMFGEKVARWFRHGKQVNPSIGNGIVTITTYGRKFRKTTYMTK